MISRCVCRAFAFDEKQKSRLIIIKSELVFIRAHVVFKFNLCKLFTADSLQLYYHMFVRMLSHGPVLDQRRCCVFFCVATVA